MVPVLEDEIIQIANKFKALLISVFLLLKLLFESLL